MRLRQLRKIGYTVLEVRDGAGTDGDGAVRDGAAGWRVGWVGGRRQVAVVIVVKMADAGEKEVRALGSGARG